MPPPPVKDSSDDLFAALVDWTQSGKGPDRVVATKFAVGKPGAIDLQRPLCAYPRTARYKGTGATNAAENFVCAMRAGGSKGGLGSK